MCLIKRENMLGKMRTKGEICVIKKEKGMLGGRGKREWEKCITKKRKERWEIE